MILLGFGIVVLLLIVSLIVLIFSIMFLVSDECYTALSRVIAITLIVLSAITFPCMIACTVASYSADTDNMECLDKALDSSTSLYALGSGDGVHGHFVFGCGTVNDIQYYIGYTCLGNDSYTQVKYDAKYTLLKLNDTEIPRADTYSAWIIKHTALPFLGVDCGRIPANVIYIPTDGIMNVYSVN